MSERGPTDTGISMREEIFPSDLETIRPTEQVKSVLEIDFERYRNEHGIRFWGFDIEGTIARPESKDPRIPKEFVEHIGSAVDEGHIDEVVLITNRRDPGFLDESARIMNVRFAFMPSENLLRKPNPDMLLHAVKTFEIDPSEAGYVGDKLTGDIRAANEAGYRASIWVTPRYSVDGEDHGFDFIRRAAEWDHAMELGLKPEAAGIFGQGVLWAMQGYKAVSRKIRS